MSGVAPKWYVYRNVAQFLGLGLTMPVTEFSSDCGGCSDLSSVWVVNVYLGYEILSSKLGCVEVYCGLLGENGRQRLRSSRIQVL